MRSIAFASFCFLLSSGLAIGAPITGNPAADGWTAGGNSLSLGTYIRGSGNMNYTPYSTSFVLQAGSPLIGGGWQAGDVILGLGGVAGPSGDLSLSVRLVSKFGTSPTSWSPSSTAVAPGDGNGSLSGGAGGVGSILLATQAPGPQLIIAANANQIQTPTVTQVYNGLDNPALISDNVGKYIFTMGPNTNGNVLSTWEMFLNTSLLDRIDGTVDGMYLTYQLPLPGDRGNQTLQRSNNPTLFVDALIGIPELQATAAPVPEPASLAVWSLIAAAGAGYGYRRRTLVTKA